MLGRGIDQLMPHHCDPALQEPVARRAIRGFQLRPITAADRSLLERQMALESLPLQWRCHSHGAGWRLQPSGGTSAANPPRRAVQPRHGP